MPLASNPLAVGLRKSLNKNNNGCRTIVDNSHRVMHASDTDIYSAEFVALNLELHDVSQIVRIPDQAHHVTCHETFLHQKYHPINRYWLGPNEQPAKFGDKIFVVCFILSRDLQIDIEWLFKDYPETIRVLRRTQTYQTSSIRVVLSKSSSKS